MFHKDMYITEDSVSIRTESEGENHRISFVNSEKGRIKLQESNFDDDIKQSIFLYWGEEITVIEED